MEQSPPSPPFTAPFCLPQNVCPLVRHSLETDPVPLGAFAPTTVSSISDPSKSLGMFSFPYSTRKTAERRKETKQYKSIKV